jgi:hypothetical protein
VYLSPTVPVGRTVSEPSVRLGVIDNEKAAAAVWPCPSTTDATNVEAPAASGMPLMVPSGESVRPEGISPEKMAHSRGAVPLADSVALYQEPAVALERTHPAMLIGESVNRLMVAAATWGGLEESVTVTLMVSERMPEGEP